MRIGEVLIEQRKLRASDLTRALSDQPAGKRLCSFLIAKGLVDFDDASRALGEQRGVACALAKHLAGRDPAMAKLIPAELGRGSCALPIGKSSKGSIIVCVRDPAPALLRALEQAIRSDILMVIAPAARLEHLVGEAYGTGSAEELDIDFDMGNDLPPPSRVTRGPLPTPPTPFQRVEVAPTYSPRAPRVTDPLAGGAPPRASDLRDPASEATPPPLPPLPDMSSLDPESIRLSLTDLDDVRVTKDPAQSGQIPKLGGTLPPPNKPSTLPPPNQPSPLPPPNQASALPPAAIRPLSTPPPPMSALAAATNVTVSRPTKSNEPPSSRPRVTDPSGPASGAERPRMERSVSLQSTTDGLEHATTREAATDLVLSYVATRWTAGLVLAIRDKTAIGYRGHGVSSPESVTVSLGSPSTVQRAVQTRFVSIEAPSGVGQSALTHALNSPRAPAAAPVVVNGQAVAVIAVSDPLEGPQARDMAAADLAMLAEALGSAYKRIMSR